VERQVGTPDGEGAAVERLAALLTEAAGSAVVLTGAGVSVPSGIRDFRTPDTGLWANVDPSAA
jgi:NAD-dependent deacetylase